MSKGPSNTAEATVGLAAEETKETLPARDAVTQYLATIGQRGGIKGGKARAASLTAERRKEIAQKAALVRWQSGRKR